MFFAMSGLSSTTAVKPKKIKAMKVKSISLIALVALIIPAAVQAQARGNPGQSPARGTGAVNILERFDTNQNGSLSKDEVRGRLANNFEAIDADGDGEITRREMRTFRQARMNRKGPAQ